MKEIRRTGFTLIEMMAVVSIIALVAAMVLPTAARMFSASSDEQARSVLGAMLSGNRAAAIENSCYTAVHVQMGKDGKCWAVAMTGERRDDGIVFVAMEGAVPKRMPGGIAFGGISDRFVEAQGGNEPDRYQDLPDGDLEDFTSFTVAFAPDGTAITNIDDERLKLENNVKLFCPDDEDEDEDDIAIWETCPGPEFGVRAVTYFSYPKVKALPATGGPGITTRTMYLSENAQFICLNYLTGRLMEAK